MSRNTGVAILAIILLTTAPLYASSTCSTTCQSGTSVSCTGDTCTANGNTVTCTTTQSCGSGCTTTSTTTKTCSSSDKPPIENPE